MAYKDGELSLALASIKSPDKLRLKALNNLSGTLRSRMVDLMSRIQEDKDYFDPKSVFPSVITSKLLGVNYPATLFCNICNGGFLEGSDVVWKNCGAHLHLKCFRDRVADVGMPLLGPCGCV